jgi:hypothetical protein
MIMYSSALILLKSAYSVLKSSALMKLVGDFNKEGSERKRY